MNLKDAIAIAVKHSADRQESDEEEAFMAKPNRTPRLANANQQLLTLTQVRMETGIPQTSIRDLINKGHLPVVRLPDARKIWIRRADLDELIRRSTVRSEG